MGIALPHGSAGGGTLRLALCLLGALLLGGCGRDAAPDGEGGREPPEAVVSTTGTDSGGLPISASISADSAPAAPDGDPVATITADAREAGRVVEAYYAAIDVGDYERAFGYWGDSGRSSGQSYLQFVAGFAETAGVTVSLGEPGRVEGAAGSRFIEIPVEVVAESKRGGEQRFEGSYTLRRSVVDGATPEQRRWHLHDAELREVQ